MKWNNILEHVYSTYPKEGIPVLVSDEDDNYDVAWFLMSGEYVWMKDDVRRDDSYPYHDMEITKWLPIPEEENYEWKYNNDK